MPRALDAQWHSLSFSAMILREIMDNPLKDETAQSRLKQIGMMSVLYYMHVGQRPLTLPNIVEMTGLTRTGVTETVEQLIRRKMLTDTIVRNSMGRGRARKFEIAPQLFEKVSTFDSKD